MSPFLLLLAFAIILVSGGAPLACVESVSLSMQDVFHRAFAVQRDVESLIRNEKGRADVLQVLSAFIDILHREALALPIPGATHRYEPEFELWKDCLTELAHDDGWAKSCESIPALNRIQTVWWHWVTELKAFFKNVREMVSFALEELRRFEDCLAK